MQGIGLLLMTISFLGLVAGAGVVAYALVRGKPALIRGVAVLAGAWAAVHLVLLLGTSLASHETVLGSGQRKAFCGFYLDCHLGVAVEAVQRTDRVGEGAQQQPPPSEDGV